MAAACIGGGVRAAGVPRNAGRRVDAHLHLWTPDAENFPAEVPVPAHLNDDGRGSFENFVELMNGDDVEQAVVIQPINYGQDYSYLLSAMDAHGDRLKGMFVADPTVPSAEAADWLERMAGSHPGWVGVRFNPYKWPKESEQRMADETGKELFRKAGELGLVVGFMPFQGLSKHVEEVLALLESSPETLVIIDHWGFFLQPALGFGDDRVLDEESWQALLKLSEYPQVHVKVSALFRVASDAWPFASLSDRFEQLLEAFGARRLLWGSDFPYVTEHCEYSAAVHAIEEWPVWETLSDADRSCILHGTAEKLFRLAPPPSDPSDEL